MGRHLIVVSEKKIKMLKLLLSPHKGKYYRWHHNNFLPMTHLYYKYLRKLGLNQVHYAGSYGANI